MPEPMLPYEVPTDRIIYLLTVIAGVPMTPYTDPTNRIIELLELIAGGGGGGGGTVTSVGSQSNSLRITSSANPINTTGDIGFEIQTIPLLKAGAIALEAGGNPNTFFQECAYEIIDFNQPIGNGKILTKAIFHTYRDASGFVRFRPYGIATSNGANLGGLKPKYEIAFNFQTNFLSDVYLPFYNQRARRAAGSTSNAIEFLPWESAASPNFLVIESDILQYPFVTVPIITNSFINSATIDWAFNQSLMIANSRIKPGATVTFVGNVPAPFLDGVDVEENAQLLVRGMITSSSYGQNSNSDMQSGGVVTSRLRVGQGQVRAFNEGTAPQSDVTSDNSIHDYQRFDVSDGGNANCLDSYAPDIFVNINPDAGGITTAQIQFPANPFHKQVIHFAFNEPITGALTWVAGGGITITGAPGKINNPPECLSFIYTDDGGGLRWTVV